MEKITRATLRYVITLYRYMISPLLGQHCRFYPSCSAYALDAIKTFGAIKGLFLALKRLLRCHPFSVGGLDPIPENFSNKVKTPCQKK